MQANNSSFGQYKFYTDIHEGSVESGRQTGVGLQWKMATSSTVTRYFFRISAAEANYTVSQKCNKFERVELKIVWIDFDDIRRKYSKDSRIEFACFSSHLSLLVITL